MRLAYLCANELVYAMLQGRLFRKKPNVYRATEVFTCDGCKLTFLFWVSDEKTMRRGKAVLQQYIRKNRAGGRVETQLLSVGGEAPYETNE